MGHVEQGIVAESEYGGGGALGGVAALLVVAGDERSPRGNQAGPVDNSTQTGSVRRSSSQHTHGSLSFSHTHRHTGGPIGLAHSLKVACAAEDNIYIHVSP